MKEKADIVAHVKVLEIMGGYVIEDGVVEYSCLCEVITPIKGKIKNNDKIRISYQIFDYMNQKETNVINKNNEIVVFLKSTTGKVKFTSDNKLKQTYNLIDHWVGALQYNPYLVERLVNYIE